MINTLAGRCSALLVPMMLAACVSGQQHTQRVLDQRLGDRLASEVSSGQAVVQKTPTGNRVILLGQSLYSNGAQVLDDQNRDVRADVIEGLLDPRLMRVQVADTSTLPAVQRSARVRNVGDYFTAYGLGPILVPADVPPDPAAPAGLAITIDVACPPPDSRTGYGDGTAHPVCD